MSISATEARPTKAVKAKKAVSKSKPAAKKAAAKKKPVAKKAAAKVAKPLSFAKAAAAYKGPLKIERKLSTLVRGVWHLRGTIAQIDATTGKKVRK